MSGNKIQKPPVLKIILSFLFIFAFGLQLAAHNLFAQGQAGYDAKGKRDPFIPLVTPDGRLLELEKEENALGLQLDGIIYDKDGLSYAIVNSEVVKVSDKVGEYQVLRIEKNKVFFIKGGEITEVALKEEEEP